MSHPRTCPHCKIILGIEDGFHFDQDLSLICDACNKPVFPTTYQAEGVIDAALRQPWPTYTAAVSGAPSRYTQSQETMNFPPHHSRYGAIQDYMD